MNTSNCKKCGKHDYLLRTIWEQDKFGNIQPVVLCQSCFKHEKNNNAVMAIFGNLKKPPKNGDLINE